MTMTIKWILGIMIILTTLSVVLFGYNQHFFEFSTSIDSERFAQFGTFISAIFGSVTIWLLYLTYQQTRETHRVTIDNSIDTNFFNLLQSYRSITSHLHERAMTTGFVAQLREAMTAASDESRIGVEKDFFELFYRMLHLKYKGKDSLRDKSKILDFFKSYDWMVGHYFKSIVYFLKWVNENHEIDTERKRFYMGFIQAQLTQDELRLLFYYLVIKEGQAYESLDKYDLFGNVKDVLIYDPEDWIEFNKFKNIVREM